MGCWPWSCLVLSRLVDLYLLAGLLGTALTFTTIDRITFGIWPAALVAVSGWIRASSARAGPGFWPLLALAAGRSLAALATGTGWPQVLVSWGGAGAYFVWRSVRIRPQLRRLSLLLLLVQAAQLLAGGYLVNSNLTAHLLLTVLAGWLPGFPNLGGLLVLLALLSTTSKGAAIGAAVLLCSWYGRGWLAAPIGGLAALGLYQLRPWGTVNWRLTCWRESIRAWLRSPWWGIGPGVSPWPAHPMGVHAHNGLLGVLTWSGLVGLGLLGVGSLPLLRASRPRWAACGLAGVLAHYLVDDFSGSAFCLVMLAALLTCYDYS